MRRHALAGRCAAEAAALDRARTRRRTNAASSATAASSSNKKPGILMGIDAEVCIH